MGNAHWDWWRKGKERPWGLPFLLVGQFGLIGFVLAFGCLLAPVFYAFAHRSRTDLWQSYPDAPLSMIVLMAIGDALFNSFIFYPALLAAGALGSIKAPDTPAYKNLVVSGKHSS